MGYDDWPNLPAMFFDQAERCGDRPFLWCEARRRLTGR